MLTLIFAILMIVVFGKLLVLAFKAAWGITKIVFTLVFLPIILIVFFLRGLVYLAFIALIIGLIVSLLDN